MAEEMTPVDEKPVDSPKKSKAKELSLDDQFDQLAAERDAIAAGNPLDREALAAADSKLKNIALGLHVGEKFSENETVLAGLAAVAKSRSTLAFRLLRQPRTHVRLIQKDAGEPQLANVDVTIDGLRMTVPRGRKVTVPQVVADILDQGNIQ